MVMFVYFAVLLVLSKRGNSLETTTSPQQQTGGDGKVLCEKSSFSHGFPGIPGSNGMPGMPGVPGPQGPQGSDGAKGETGDKGLQGVMGPRGEKGNEGSRGKNGAPGMMGIKGNNGNKGSRGNSGPQGMTGIKGDKGLMGNQGRKGDKGEKGESVKSPSCAVPQTNWKQCVWKNLDEGKDTGKIKDCSFNKLQSDTAIKVSFQGNTRVLGTLNRCNRWFFKFNGAECRGPTTIEAVVYNIWQSSAGNPNLHHHRSFEGYCENIPQGRVTVELWVGQCPGYPMGDANTGFDSVSRIMIEEVSRAQS